MLPTNDRRAAAPSGTVRQMKDVNGCGYLVGGNVVVDSLWTQRFKISRGHELADKVDSSLKQEKESHQPSLQQLDYLEQEFDARQ